MAYSGEKLASILTGRKTHPTILPWPGIELPHIMYKLDYSVAQRPHICISFFKFSSGPIFIFYYAIPDTNM